MESSPKLKAHNEITRSKFKIDEAMSELFKAKENYKDVLVADTIKNLLEIQKEDGELTERHLQIFLNSLATDLRNIYS